MVWYLLWLFDVLREHQGSIHIFKSSESKECVFLSGYKAFCLYVNKDSMACVQKNNFFLKNWFKTLQIWKYLTLILFIIGASVADTLTFIMSVTKIKWFRQCTIRGLILFLFWLETLTLAGSSEMDWTVLLKINLVNAEFVLLGYLFS